MSEKYKFRNPEGIYFITCTVVSWIDLVTRKEYKHILLTSLKYYQNKRSLSIHAYCIMPSHLHLIVSSNENLSGILRDFKKMTNKKIIEEIGLINESRRDWLLRAFVRAGQNLKRIKGNKLWQDGNHPIELNSNQLIDQKLNYIHMNPVEAEIVDDPAGYWYSSARDYEGRKGLLDVILID